MGGAQAQHESGQLLSAVKHSQAAMASAGRVAHAAGRNAAGSVVVS
jgi:hypothetical protein